MLIRKQFRTFLQYKAQFISMIIMVALGVGVFLGANIEWYSLRKDTDEMFAATGFADYRIYSEKGFSRDDLNAIMAVEGVEDAARFLSVNTAVEGGSDVLALTVCENMNVSGILLMEGEAYEETDPDGMWLSDSYAEANGIHLGDSLTLTYKTISVTGQVKGLIKASEYLICLPDETQLMPDYSSYGYVYISPVMLENAIPKLFRGLIGSLYYQINVISDLDKPAFVKAADEALGTTRLVLSREETISWAETQGEIEEGKTMGAILPVLFLAIAVLTMVTTMHRITASEKTQIGTLKALGFRDSRILVHYTSYALLIGITGSAAGILLGYLLAWYILKPDGAMATYIDLPSWKLYMPWFCAVVLVLINAALIIIGFLSVKKMLHGTAADALRPYSPKKMRHLRIEETRGFKKLGFGTKWNLRDCLRHRSRSFMTLFGIIGCMVLLVGGLGMRDTMDAFMDVFYENAIHYKTRFYLDAETVTNEEAVRMAEEFHGDWCAQSSVQIGDRGFGLEVYSITRDMVRFPDQNMKFLPLGDDGVYICSRIAKEFGLEPGDSFSFSPYDSDKTYTVTVEAVLSSMSESVVMTEGYAEKAGIPYTINLVFTDETEIPVDSRILNSQSKQAIMDSFDTFTALMDTMVWILMIAAVILGIVVLYNLGIMSYTERYREMATLKVVGFQDRKISRLLISQNLWLTVLGILIGLPAGICVLQYLLDALASEYEMKLALGAPTYLVSILLTFGVSLIVGLMISRKNKYIDMVAALKASE